MFAQGKRGGRLEEEREDRKPVGDAFNSIIIDTFQISDHITMDIRREKERRSGGGNMREGQKRTEREALSVRAVLKRGTRISLLGDERPHLARGFLGK